jgi:hypothetical protein
MRPGPEPALRDLEAAPSPSSMLVAGTRTFSNSDLGMAMRRVVVAEHRQHATIFTPGVSIGTRIMLCCSWRFRLSDRSCP